MPLTNPSKPRLLILVNRDWFFLSHLKDRALAAQKAGYHVIVVSPDSGLVAEIKALGLEHHRIDMDRHGVHPIRELHILSQLKKLYQTLRPELCWHVGLKAIVLGTLAAQWARRCGWIINAPVGMGFVYASSSRKARLLRPWLQYVLKYLLNPNKSRVVFENPDDLNELAQRKIIRKNDAVLIRGAGVNLEEFRAVPEPQGIPVILFAARLIREKGVEVFCEAARILKNQGISARFWIAGGIDQDSSSAISEEQLQQWVNEIKIEWLGNRKDMPDVMAGCHIFCLPSWYREGLPKVLLEAMASQRVIITTDTVGCRESVIDGKNGLLIPPYNAEALAERIRYLIEHPELRQSMAKYGRTKAEQEFSTERVCNETLDLFDGLKNG